MNSRWRYMPLTRLTLPGLILFSMLLIKPAQVLGDAHMGEQVLRAAEKTVATDADTQKKVASWVDEERELMDRIEEISASLKRSRWQLEKNKIYQKDLAAKIDELNIQVTEMEKVEAGLMPVLEETLGQLKGVVNTDLPMDLGQRRKTLTHAHTVINDYDKGMLLKTRAVFDTLSREVDIGYTVGVREDEIDVDGRLMQVKLLRVGRIGLYALPPDGSAAYIWNRDQERFVSLDETARDILQAIEMAEGVRIIGLSRVPVILPESSSQAQPDIYKGGASNETD